MRTARLITTGAPVRRAIIFALAALLISYHTYTLFDLYFGSGTDLYEVGGKSTHPYFVHTQSLLRIVIIFGLALVVMNRRLGIYAMWIGIATLVATHYWALFFDLPFRFLDGRHPASYLKGLIIPTVITVLFFSMRRRPDCPVQAPSDA